MVRPPAAAEVARRLVLCRFWMSQPLESGRGLPHSKTLRDLRASRGTRTQKLFPWTQTGSSLYLDPTLALEAEPNQPSLVRSCQSVRSGAFFWPNSDEAGLESHHRLRTACLGGVGKWRAYVKAPSGGQGTATEPGTS